MTRGRWFALFLVLAASGGGWYYWANVATTPVDQARPQGRRGMGSPDAPASVTASGVKVETVPVYREGIGNVQAFALVTVRPQIDGMLTSVEFQEGQSVRIGDVLARIDPTSLQAQLDQAQAKRAQNAASLANATMDLERYTRLAATNAGPRQQADQQKSTVTQLEAQLRADDAAITSARTNLGYTAITSPINGRAGLRQVDAGNIINASNAAGLVTIAQVQPISVVFTLPQRDLAVVPAALARGAVLVETLESDGRTVVATGTLEVIDNQVDVATGTIKLKAVFANEDLKLWPGQFVSVRLKVAELTGARTVPTPALRRGPGGAFVYVVGEGDKAVVRPVTIVQQDEQRAVINTGLQPGERVITAGFPRLSDGKQVIVAPDPTGPDVVPVGPQRTRGNNAGQRRQGAGGQPGRANAPVASPPVPSSPPVPPSSGANMGPSGPNPAGLAPVGARP